MTEYHRLGKLETIKVYLAPGSGGLPILEAQEYGPGI
jgi:hypothetical protein